MNISPSHAKRLATAGVLIALSIIAIALGGWFMLIFALLISSQALYEFYMMFWKGREQWPRVLLGMLLGAAMLVLTFYQQWALGLGLLLAAFWLGNLGFLFTYSRQAKTDEPIQVNYQDNLILLAGLLYLPMVLQFFLMLGPIEIVAVLVATAATDIGGYYAGSLIGGGKIWPVISPKKTWSGSLGGLALCMAALLVLGLIWGSGAWWTYLVLGFILNLAAQLGDFFESALKRRQGVKDTGAILPGHGGLLDRIDSLIFVLPVFMAGNCFYPLFILPA